MSNIEEPNNFSIMCRLCLSQDVELINIYTKDEFKRMISSNKIAEIIERFTTIKIRPSDNLPQRICMTCSQTIKSMLAFQNQCKRNDKELQKLLEESSTTVGEWEHVLIKSEKVEEHEQSNGTESVDEPKNMSETGNMVRPIAMLEVNVKESDSDDEVGNNEEKSKSTSTTSGNPGNKSSKQYPTVACHICGKLFVKYRLQFHLNEHNGLRPYKCDVDGCTSTFTAPYDLKGHKRYSHRSPRWKCDVCDKAFKRGQALQIHRRSHFDPDIPCKICQKLFKTPKGLIQHMLVHTQERKFKCDSCSKSFLTRYTLRIHKRVHTQEKPYSCHCGVSFAYNCLLKAHKQKYHPDSDEAKLS